MLIPLGSGCKFYKEVLGSIAHIRRHKVWLSVKPVLLLAVIFLSVVLVSCGRLDMEGYAPRGTDVVNQEEINEMPNINHSTPRDNQSGEDSYPESTDIHESTIPTEPVNTPEPSITPEQTHVPAPVSTPEPTPAPTPIATPEQTPQPEASAGIVNPYVPYTYDQMIEDSQKLKDMYPDIISLDVAGYSVEGRELTLIKLGREDKGDKGDKGQKKIILCGSHHAREYITSSYLMKMTEEYCKAYYSGNNYGKYNTKEILDKICLYIVPMVNPDGVNLVINGVESVKNQESVAAMAMLRGSYKQWKANINGVDLNRQYPAEWEKKYDEVGKPASESYKGESSATEPEIKAMMELSKSNEFILAASFHTKGSVIYWADRGTVNLIPGVKDMVRRLARLTNYSRMPISEDPSIYGAGYENWFRLQFLRPALCIELTPYNNTDVPHDDKKFDSLVWNSAKYIGLFLADEALNR